MPVPRTRLSRINVRQNEQVATTRVLYGSTSDSASGLVFLFLPAGNNLLADGSCHHRKLHVSAIAVKSGQKKQPESCSYTTDIEQPKQTVQLSANPIFSKLHDVLLF